MTAATRPTTAQLPRLRRAAADRGYADAYERVLADHRDVDRDLTAALVDEWIADLERLPRLTTTPEV
jgi:hypothetical protein